MPSFLIFAPCEKVILAQNSNAISLISILQDLTIGLPADTQVPEEIAAPFRWYGFVMWKKEAEDEGKSYVQELELCRPDGATIATGESLFRITGSFHRATTEFLFFPVHQSGSYSLNLYLREDKEEKRKFIASFPLTITKKAKT